MSEASEGLGRERFVILVGLMLAILLGALDQTIVSTALPDILAELGASSDKISWIVSSYLITIAASMPLYGRLSDMYGRKNLFEFSILTFLVGSGLCGVSQSILQLALFRAIQGIGGGGLISLAMTIIGDIFSPRERGKYVSYLIILLGLSNVGGPLLGGYLTDNFSWRWIFYINLPIGLAALAIIERSLDLPIPDEDHVIDVFGVGLLFVATTAIVLVATWGGGEYDWTSIQILLLAEVAVLASALFLFQERVTEEPILPLHLFGNPVVASVIGLSFFVGLGRLVVITYVPTFLQYATGTTATHAGVLLTPMILGMVGVSFVTGQLITRTGRYKPFPVVGTVFAAVGFYLLSTVSGTTPFSHMAVFMVVTGAGFGLVMPVLTTAAQNAVEARYLGVTTTTLSYSRSLAGAIGVAVFGSIYTNGLDARLATIFPRVRTRGGGLDPVRLHSPAVSRTVRAEVIDAIAKSIDAMFLWAIPLFVVAFVLALYLPEWELDRTAHVEMSEDDDDAEGDAPRPHPTDD